MNQKLVWASAMGLCLLSGPSLSYAFNPQPDPPAFGLIGIIQGQVVRLNAVCWPHNIGSITPSACSADFMFHDKAGNVRKKISVRLRPGESASLDWSPATAITSTPGRFEVQPCIIPDPDSGLMIPTAEVFNAETGLTSLVVNPVTPRVSFIAGPQDAGR